MTQRYLEVGVFQVEKLITTENDLRPILEHGEYVKMWKTDSLKEVIVVGQNCNTELITRVFGVPCSTVEPFKLR